MRTLIILALLQLSYSLSNLTQEYKKCTFTFCQQDQNCSDQAYSLLFCAIKKCPIPTLPSSNISTWYLCFQKSFMTCKVQNQVVNQAALNCFANYNWNQDQINTSNYNDYLRIKPILEKIQNLQQNNTPLNNIQPCYQFPYVFNNCINIACQANYDCIRKNIGILQCAITQGNDASDLESWYSSFSKAFNSQTCKPQGLNQKYVSDFCFMKYNWNQDCLYFQTQ
ncbi:hypothetical protein ABPG74_002544 [Tetrahymena malaccensis]